MPLSDWIADEGAAFTLPTLDLEDFIGLGFTTGPDGKVYQLPDQQFANLYWFRHDWFQRPDPQVRHEAGLSGLWFLDAVEQYATEEGQGVTVDYETLLEAWREGKVSV